jgi:hypothetical protein
VYNAKLDYTLGKDAFDGIGKALQIVCAGDQDIFHPAGFQVGD